MSLLQFDGIDRMPQWWQQSDSMSVKANRAALLHCACFRWHLTCLRWRLRATRERLGTAESKSRSFNTRITYSVWRITDCQDAAFERWMMRGGYYLMIKRQRHAGWLANSPTVNWHYYCRKAADRATPSRLCVKVIRDLWCDDCDPHFFKIFIRFWCVFFHTFFIFVGTFC